jgi:hypothetical protein
VLNESLIAEELEFLAAPCEQHELFDAARLALEFDIAAFDYSFDHDGELIVWEVNPYPDLRMPGGAAADHLAESVWKTYRLIAEFYRDEIAAVERSRASARPRFLTRSRRRG